MDNSDDSQTPQIQETKRDGRWKDSYMLFLVLPVMLTILFPLGAIFYLCGRFSPYAIAVSHCLMLYAVAGVFIIYCLVAGIVTLRAGWRKQGGKKKLVALAKIGIPAVFIVLFSASVLASVEGMGFWAEHFMHGFRDRISKKTDVEATRAWLKSRGDQYDTDHYQRIAGREWPEPLKALKPGVVLLSADGSGNAKVRLMWGSGFMGHWGVEIGMEDMEIPASAFSEFGEYRVTLEPGVYVWHELQ
jgi:hypothetical protein